MGKRWCPLAHCECEEGITHHSKDMCIFWDTLENECTFSKSSVLQCDLNRKMLESLANRTGSLDFNERQ